MAKRDILKEAIADAKAVKETAIANAKAALEEAFTPQLKSMLAAKLEEIELDEELSDSDMRKYDDKGVEGGEEEEKTLNMEPGNDPEELDEEINLDEILAELEEEMDDKENIKEADESEAERADVDKYEYEEGKEEGEEEADDETEDEEIDLEDMTDDDLKGFIEDVIADMVGSGELEAGENFEEEDEDTEVEVGMEIDSEEEVELDEQFDSRVSAKGGNPYDTGEKSVSDDVKKALSKLVGLPAATMKKLTDYANSLEKDPKHKYKSGKFASVTKEAEEIDENQKLKRELKEAHATIKTQGSTLNEVNLLNAKLLYTNKIFRAKTLTESQKVKVLGAFDKAGTVKETKLVFETLNEGLKTKRSPIQESLGSASKVTGNYKRTKNPIVETDPMVARFQKLAGLK
tara:strand:+ start:176 stop:1387 length:1212 start_codon:yes stop_codon:yes gene_type:complete